MGGLRIWEQLKQCGTRCRFSKYKTELRTRSGFSAVIFGKAISQRRGLGVPTEMPNQLRHSRSRSIFDSLSPGKPTSPEAASSSKILNLRRVFGASVTGRGTREIC